MVLYNIEEFSNMNCDDMIITKQSKKHLLPKLRFQQFKHTKDKHPLQFYGCTNVFPLPDKITDMYYTTYQEFDSTSIYNVYDKIVDDLSKTKLNITEELIDGSIYVVIYQDENTDENDQMTHTKLFIIYTKYNTNHMNKIVKKQVESDNKTIDSFVVKNMHSCKGTVYLLNKNNRLFVNLLSEKQNILL
jgi:hypothetical protein